MKKTEVIKADFAWKDWTESDIKNTVSTVKNILDNHKKETISLKDEVLNFKNVIHSGEIVSAQISQIAGYIWSFINLSKDAKLQEEARKVELELETIIRKFAYDEEMYNVFKKYFVKHKKEVLGDEEKKIVEDANKSYIKMGMALDKKTKKVLMDKQNKISKLVSDFEKLATLNYVKGLYFSLEELAGVPEGIIKNFKYDEKKKKYFVSIRPTEMSNVVKYCVVESTRKRLTELSAYGVGDVNTKKFAEILKLRSEIAQILGFKTYASLSMSEEMVSTEKEAIEFLQKFLKEVTPTFKKDKIEELTALKEQEKSAKKLNTWNWAYATNLNKEKTLKVKEEEFKPYFELESCLQVLFGIWSDIFGVTTSEIKGEIFFDESARVYEFKDKKSGSLLGTGVFDLFPRAGKYGHACMNDISKTHVDLLGNRQASLIYLICNFMQDKSGKTLLSFNDVITLFHEGGHFLHFLLMKNKYISSGSVSNDFVEIPSQFHENFLLNEKFVQKNFKHFESGKSMSKDLLSKVVKIGTKGEASTWVIQTMYSLFDQEVHGKNISKYAKNFKELDNLYEKMFAKYICIESTKNRHFTSRFSHLTGGYQAKYYSYVVSRVYAQDFWEKFSSGGVKKNKGTESYKKLLEAGGTKKEKDLVKDFLGRKVNLKAFLKIIK